MLKILAIIAIVIVIPIVAVLAYAATQPNTFRIERMTSIKAPPEKIYPLISDLRGFSTWSPYEKKDPDMKRTFSAASSGEGASYEWDGDKNVGAGRMEIAEATPPSKVTFNLEFVRPFEARNTVDFTLQPNGDATNVTWAMHGPVPFISKVMCLFFNMDKMVGSDFEAGLANLKSLAES